MLKLPQAARKAACMRAGTIKFTSRILEGLTARRGLVEPREGIGCWVSVGRGLVLGCEDGVHTMAADVTKRLWKIDDIVDVKKVGR